MHITEIASRIPVDVAQLAVARVLVALGSETDWSADTLDCVAAAVGQARPEDLPPVFDQDESALNFWQEVEG